MGTLVVVVVLVVVGGSGCGRSNGTRSIGGDGDSETKV